MKRIINKIKSTDRGTVWRTVSLVVAIINQAVAVIGSSSFASASWYQILSLIALALTSCLAAWENNDWTHFAQIGTAVLDALEDGKITEDEIKKLLEKAGERKDDDSNVESK